MDQQTPLVEEPVQAEVRPEPEALVAHPSEPQQEDRFLRRHDVEMD